MHVGLCRVKLRLPENASLKGKRQVIKSITGRVQNKFDVCIAEVDTNDAWQIATLGIACVSNDSRHANEVISRVVNFISDERLDCELLDYETEVLTAFGE